MARLETSGPSRNDEPVVVDALGHDVTIEIGGQTVYLPIDLARKVARDIETNVQVILIKSGVVRV